MGINYLWWILLIYQLNNFFIVDTHHHNELDKTQIDLEEHHHNHKDGKHKHSHDNGDHNHSDEKGRILSVSLQPTHLDDDQFHEPHQEQAERVVLHLHHAADGEADGMDREPVIAGAQYNY